MQFHCSRFAASRGFAVLLAVLLALAIPAAAQFTTASLQGTVADTSGAVMPGASVTVTNLETGFAQKAETTASGTYLFPRLPVGKYSLLVSKPGFTEYNQTGITLTVSQTATQNVTLQVGATATALEVTAEAPLVTTGSAQVGTLVDQKRITELPLNGRNAQALVFLAPGAVDVTSRYCGYDCHGGVYPSEQQAAVNGSGPQQVNYQLDGVNHNDTFLNMNLPFPNPDSVQEFSLQTNSLSAEYGSSASGAVNIVTKSGTNQIHGSAFDFLRNGSLNARNFFGKEHDTLNRNQFGGSIGGPIRKDRLFYFGSYQGTRQHYASQSQLTFVPTAAERLGDFSSTTQQLEDPVTGTAYAGNQVPVNQVSKYIMDRIPLPNPAAGDSPRALHYVGPLSRQQDDQYLGKIDWNAGRQQWSGRYFYSEYQQPASTPENNLILSDNHGSRIRIQNYGLVHTFTVSPTVIANTSVGYSRQIGGNFSSAPFGLTAAGQKIATPKEAEIVVGVEHGFGIDTNHRGAFNRSDASLRENITHIRGNHELHAGAELTRLWNRLDNQFLQSGNFTFAGAMSGDTMADFVIGRVNWFMQGGGEQKDLAGMRYGFFVQDNWRTTPRLTLNAGLRWDPYIPYEERDGRTACFIPGAKSTRYPNAPVGLVYGGEGGCPKNAVNSYLGAFAPRFGFAYRITDDGKTSIRGGIGMYYSATATNWMMYHYNAPFAPWFGMPNVDFTDPWAGKTNPYPASYASNVPDSSVAFQLPVNLRVVARDWQPSYVTTWNLTLERQLTNTLLLRSGYIGNNGKHLANTVGWPNTRDINAPRYIPTLSHWDDTDARRPYQGFGNIDTFESSSNSNYHAFQFTVEQRFSRGVSLNANYTFSKTLDDLNWLNPFDRHWNWGISNDNIPHNFKVSSIWELPKTNWTGLPGAVVNGWSLNSIVNWRSGFPISVYSGNDNSWSNIWGDRADYIGGDWKLPSGRPHGELINAFFNTKVFKTAKDGTFGNAPKNFMTGPRFFQTDMVLTKSFRLAERAAVNFRAEAFNLFNNVNFNRPAWNVDNKNTFGKITSAGDPRILQGALKFTF